MFGFLALGLHRMIRQASCPDRHPSYEVVGVTWASPFTRRLAKATGRIEFTCVTDESFAWGCSPPRLVATQLPSATRSQTSSRRGLAPRLFSTFTGARVRRESPLWYFSSFLCRRKNKKNTKAAILAALQISQEVEPAPLRRRRQSDARRGRARDRSPCDDPARAGAGSWREGRPP